jgi:hypothetical protein
MAAGGKKTLQICALAGARAYAKQNKKKKTARTEKEAAERAEELRLD